jgi:hypothetical protein
MSASKGIIDAEGLNIGPKGFFEVHNGLILRLSFAVSRDIGNAGSKSTEFGIGNQFND